MKDFTVRKPNNVPFGVAIHLISLRIHSGYPRLGIDEIFLSRYKIRFDNQRLDGEYPMHRKDVAEQITKVARPFYITLNTGEQICCNEIVSFDDALTVVVGEADLKMIFPHDIQKIFF
jgi:hypothetical protein